MLDASPSLVRRPVRALLARAGRASPEVVRVPETANPRTNETMKPEAPKTCLQRWRNAAVSHVVVSNRVRLPSNVAPLAVATCGAEPTTKWADTAGGSRGEILFEARDAVRTASRNTLGPGWGTRLDVRGGDEMAASWGLGVSSREGGAAQRPGPWGQARRIAPSDASVVRDARHPPWGVPWPRQGTAESGPV